ncbi:hypothetical protein GTU99_32675 [Streptomyces sp. PRKS01-65]|nr:hypothetical protein [Streptomyces harenosi]
MNRRLSGLACALILVASAGATGCFGDPYSSCPGAGGRPEGLSTRDMVGAYRSSAAGLVLRSDGTFTTVGWPTDLDGAVSDPQSRTGSGTWELTAADDSGWPVSFSFHKISGYWDSDVRGGYYEDGLMVSGSRDHPRLYAFAGDPDSCDLVTFTRGS